MNAWGDSTYHSKRQLDRCTHFCTTMQQIPHWLQWDTQNLLPFDDNYPHLIHLPSTDGPITVPNGIRIQSAILPQYTLRTDRLTDRWSRQMFSNMSAPLAMLTDSDALKPNFCIRCPWLSPLPAPLLLCYVLLVIPPPPR